MTPLLSTDRDKAMLRAIVDQARAQSDHEGPWGFQGRPALKGCTSRCDAPRGFHACGDYPAPETLEDLDRQVYGPDSLKTKAQAAVDEIVARAELAFEDNAKALGYQKSTEDDGSNPKDRMGAAKAPTLSVIPASSILALGGVMRLGAAKYGRFNWRQKPVKATVYADAALRHLMSFMDGEDVDPESGELHLAHVMACMSIVIDAKARGALMDDRDLPASPVGTAAEIIRITTRTVH